MVKMTAGKR